MNKLAGIPSSLCAKSWINSFFRHLRAELGGAVSDFNSLRRRSREHAARLLDDPVTPVIQDERGRIIAACCATVLASYRELLVQVPEEDAIHHIQAAASRVYQKPTHFMTRVWLIFVRRPLKQLSRQRWKKLNDWMFGSGMEFDQHESDQHVELVIQRCAFQAFFAAHGEPDLTRAFCGWDRNWMDVIDRRSPTIRTERPTTLSTGGECCQFRFVARSSEEPDQGDIILKTLRK